MKEDPSTHRAYSKAGATLAEAWAKGKTCRAISRKANQWQEEALAMKLRADWRLSTFYSAAVNRMETLYSEQAKKETPA
jgi:hypothetical protein